MYSRRTSQRIARPQIRVETLYTRVLGRVDDVLYDTYGRGWEHVRVEKLSSAIEEARRCVHRTEGAEQREYRMALLLLQTPRAVRAQNAMDARHGGYRQRHKRLFELIDFNDTFVDVVLSLHHEHRREFEVRIFQLMRDFCRRTRTLMFTLEQFDAISHGLSREIAVYLGARAEGFDVHMTSRVADGLGVDMQVREPTTGRYLNIDCKTTRAYLRRVEDLRRMDRLSDDEVAVALTRGYVQVVNGSGEDRVVVVLFCIVSELFGGVRGFEFADTRPLAVTLRAAIDTYGQTGADFYKYRERED